MTRVLESPRVFESFLGSGRPFFFQLTSTFKPMTLQINVMFSPAKTVRNELPLITAVGFPNIRRES